MAPTPRIDGPLNINLSGLSPIIEPNSSSAKSPFGGPKTGAPALAQTSRVGTGSPLHESAQRLFPKRTRELQTPNNTLGNIWGPPTSGTSTPLFEIPESPNQDGFPDLVPLTETGINSPARRGRAGTLPSRISPTVTSTLPSSVLLTSKTSRPTPTTSPFRPASTSASEKAFNAASTASANSTSALLSRLRAGSMPQRASLFTAPNVISGQSPFSTAWNSRARAVTLSSISSAEDPVSPQQFADKENVGARTLDYLGLAETSADSTFRSDEERAIASAAFLTSFDNKNASRFRSFSVNTSSKYSGHPQDAGSQPFPATASGTMTPSAAAALEAEYEAIQERVRLHNKAVQDFALNATAARPRARTAGLVDTPQRSLLRRFGQNLLKENDPDVIQAVMASGDVSSGELSAALYNLNMGDSAYSSGPPNQSFNSYDSPDDSHSQASRSLWIGSIPNSTTVSTLDTIFSSYGTIESTRVLTHKNCGFVNFENVQDAVRARQLLNGNEIFPGSGLVRIGFAKAPSNSVTPLQGTTSQSPIAGASQDGVSTVDQIGESSNTSTLASLKNEILDIVKELGAQSADLTAIAKTIDNSVNYEHSQREVPAVGEPNTNRLFDAPRLRDVRKRIDNGQCSVEDVEQVAIEMLPEIAELASDYLGNTVVQKLFEICSEEVKERMLECIAPHLAEVGVHKNGTWAAQKIIDVCKSETQGALIVEHLRPYTIPLFLDQFGNYVVQCCLRFGPSQNAFIFETMASHLVEISQGRFGARAMRACLESHNSSKDQQRLLAAIVSLNSVQLATNTNGALLLTWLLDTCNFPRRRSVLAPRLIPHLVQLCTHKVAYLTVLKVVNQRNESEARDAVLKALFFSPGDTVLEQILSDQSSGVTCIFKILTSPFLEESMRVEVIQKTSDVLVRIEAQPNQGYKRLMDEVGLSSRQPPAGPNFGHGAPRSTGPGGVGGYNNGYSDHGMMPVRSNSGDSFGYSNGNFGMTNYQNQSSSFGAMGYPSMGTSGQGQLPGQGVGQGQYSNYTSPGSRNAGSHHGYGANGYTGYNTPPSTVDFRAMQNQAASPIPYTAQMSSMNNGGFASGYNQAAMQNNMYNYGGGPVQQPMYGYNGQMQPVQAGGRGGRRTSGPSSRY